MTTAKTFADLSDRMAEMDIAILSTITTDGSIAGRPMSNNSQVEYDGTSYYFTNTDTRTVSDVKANPNVGLGFQGADGFYLAVEGQAELVRDKGAFREHWTPDLDTWFADGIDTDDLVLVKVVADRAHYWDGRDEGEITL